MYYKLSENCQLVKGSCRGAIYDFQSGKVFSINGDAFDLLEKCRDNPIKNVLDLDLPSNKHVLDFMDHLTHMGIGSFYINKPEEKHVPPIEDQEVKLSFLWLELTSKCNNKCLHCYSSSDGFRDDDHVTHDRWMTLISEARKCGANSIQFIGGEPLLYPKWKELVLKANEEGFEYIEIFTNATLITDSHIEFFKKNNVNIATTIYADNPEIHDKVTLNQGSFTKTLNALKKITNENIPVRVESIIMKANENEAENIKILLNDMGIYPKSPDVVRPTGRGDDDELLPTKYKKDPIRPPFYTSSWQFWQAHNYHSCLAGKIAITSAGDVIPCIFARNEVCGNVLNSSLDEILNGTEIQKYWKTTKDHVKKCKDCEYRYACYDCRPKAMGTDPSKDWFAPSADCFYNPYTGTWDEMNEKSQNDLSEL